MPRKPPPAPAPRIVVAGTEFPPLLSISQFAAFTGRSASYIYDGVSKGNTPVPALDASGKVGFSTVAICELLGIPFEVVVRTAVAA